MGKIITFSLRKAMKQAEAELLAQGRGCQLLEQNATGEQKERKIDVVDFYFERRH